MSRAGRLFLRRQLHSTPPLKTNLRPSCLSPFAMHRHPPPAPAPPHIVDPTEDTGYPSPAQLGHSGGSSWGYGYSNRGSMRRHEHSGTSEWPFHVIDGQRAGQGGAGVHIVDATEDGAEAAPVRASAAGADNEWAGGARWPHGGIAGGVVYERGRGHDAR
jgi:hypothetical protein